MKMRAKKTKHTAIEKAQIEKAFRNAEGSAAHEFGDDFDPGDGYRGRRQRIIDGELTVDEAVAEVLAPYASRSPGH